MTCDIPALTVLHERGEMWNYSNNFFPRLFRYKADALKLVRELERKGALKIVCQKVK